MKYIDFAKFYSEKKKHRDNANSTNTKSHSENIKPGMVIPFYEILKNELKLYRGSSKSTGLGVLGKYEELIAMARKN